MKPIIRDISDVPPEVLQEIVESLPEGDRLEYVKREIERRDNEMPSIRLCLASVFLIGYPIGYFAQLIGGK